METNPFMACMHAIMKMYTYVYTIIIDHPVVLRLGVCINFTHPCSSSTYVHKLDNIIIL